MKPLIFPNLQSYSEGIKRPQSAIYGFYVHLSLKASAADANKADDNT